MAVKWQEQTTTKFVELYKDHECLWDINNDLYKNRTARVCALRKIIESMNIEDLQIRDVKLKIKNLRSTYSQVVAKIKKSERQFGANTALVYQPKLRWFPIMNSFLKWDETRIHKTDETDEEYNDEENEEFENVRFKKSMQNIDEIYETNPKRAKLSPSSRIKEEEFKAAVEFPNYIPEDECQLFGRSIAVQLKKLSTKRSIYAQNEIQAILTRHRLLDLQDKENQNTDILIHDNPEIMKTQIEISDSFRTEAILKSESTETSSSEEMMDNEDIKIEYNYGEYDIYQQLNGNSMVTALEKNSRKCYTAAEKLLVIEYAEKNGNRAASRHFSVNESNVRFWRKNKEAIQVLPRKKKASRGHPPSFPHLENALVKWVVDRRQIGIRVPRIDIKLKALELKESLPGTEEFKASYGWAVRFMKRHGLDEGEECSKRDDGRTSLEPSDTNNTKFLIDIADIKVETDS